MNVDKHLLPEEEELENKLTKLTEKQNLLADRELEVATVRSRLIAFEQTYMDRVGRFYVELDEFQAQLARLRSVRFPNNSDSVTAAQTAREQAKESRAEYERKKKTFIPITSHIEPSTELKSIYRKLAKQFHPDSTLDPQEKLRRSTIMAQINDAYTRGDLVALQRMSDELAISPEAISGDGIGAELIRSIRKIAQIDKRLVLLEGELTSLKKSELFRLAEQYEMSKQQGQDLLATLAADIICRIAEIRAEIQELQAATAT